MARAVPVAILAAWLRGKLHHDTSRKLLHVGGNFREQAPLSFSLFDDANKDGTVGNTNTPRS